MPSIPRSNAHLLAGTTVLGKPLNVRLSSSRTDLDVSIGSSLFFTNR
ncbi:TPA: hypothetical protein L4741_003959 [Pseudomonas aeruginosa]|nr:hypothetical protein [Pseudomonas aeruginosa]